MLSRITDVGKIGGKDKDNTPLRIHYDGEVKWFPPLETSTSCEMRIARFPFDKQTCYIIITGWGVSISEVVLIYR